MKLNTKKLVVVETFLIALIGIMAACNQLIPALAQTIVMHRGRPGWQSVYRMHPGTSVLLNNVEMTPGVVRTTDRDEVCHGGSTNQFRKTTAAMKAEVYKEYGVDKAKPLPGDPFAGTPRPPLFEIDHLISLELGGADDVKNLWPQPYYNRPAAHEKDAVENYLHREVCAGRIALTDAQKQIADDWYAIYLKMPR